MNNSPMPPDLAEHSTVTALKASIAHWERLATGTNAPGEGVLADDCALCHEFLSGGCKDCPVFTFSGRQMCRGTPYYGAKSARGMYACSDENKQLFREKAALEVEFLNDVLWALTTGNL